MFSGPMWQAAVAARDELAERYDVGCELWSATSYKSLREDALSCERWNRLHPLDPPREPFVTQRLATAAGPIVAVSDFVKAVPDQVARWVPAPLTTLGTDGFGRSDTREALRHHFEVDTGHVVVAVLSALLADGEIKAEQVQDALQRHGIDADGVEPLRA
jgi:pyruvate dehydrogenase E1 component